MSAEQFIIHVNDDGSVRFIYSDTLAFLLPLGKAEIKRASHVEPHPGGGWTADMSPVGGPVLGPFDLRSIALSEEVAYLNEHL